MTFGSSVDRERQLAGRARKARKSSGGSQASQNGTQTTDQAPQQPPLAHAPAPPNQNTQPYSPYAPPSQGAQGVPPGAYGGANTPVQALPGQATYVGYSIAYPAPIPGPVLQILGQDQQALAQFYQAQHGAAPDVSSYQYGVWRAQQAHQGFQQFQQWQQAQQAQQAQQFEQVQQVPQMSNVFYGHPGYPTQLPPIGAYAPSQMLPSIRSIANFHQAPRARVASLANPLSTVPEAIACPQPLPRHSSAPTLVQSSPQRPAQPTVVSKGLDSLNRPPPYRGPRDSMRLDRPAMLQDRQYFSGGSGNSASSGSRSSLNKIFDKYREDVPGSPDAVGTEGTMQYLGDIGVDIEGLDALAAMELVQSPAMGEMAREGFVDGWSAVNCDSIDKQKAYINTLKKTLPSSKDAYTKVYSHTFQLAKSGNQKAIPLEMASAYWELLFTSPLSAVKWKTASSPWAEWWLEYLNNVYKRSVNKDVWNQTLKFAQLTLEDEAMSFWIEEESSWPSVIDDFVKYVKTKRPGSGEAEVMEE